MLCAFKSLVGKLLAIHILGPILTIVCPAKLWSNADFALRNYGAMQTLPRKITKP